ncbi:MAG: lytic murein transglycosylase [Mesorhizobium sp.]|nr:MAG: lytic murein transglycosylase [Mesorhizobium sp.]
MIPRRAPLCPAGHLPLKGGDWISPRLSTIFKAAKKAPSAKPPISPLEGEMSGRTEGGVCTPAVRLVRNSYWKM